MTMENYRPEMTFDEETAAFYDELHKAKHGDGSRGDTDATVAFLEGLAGGGPALELAVGTGRVAIPLAGRGVGVDGIDFAPAMLDLLRAKPGGDRVGVTLGNYADVGVDGVYRLIYLVGNSLCNLLTQEEQVRCFENVAAHLEPGGRFVVEAVHASWFHRMEDQQYVRAEALGTDWVYLDVARHDPVRQVLEESHVRLSSEGVRLNPIVSRYAWPSEMDLMARIAGMQLRERWGGWNGEPWRAGPSDNCVSVYERPAGSERA